MRFSATICAVVLNALACFPAFSAIFYGSDNFNDNSKDPSLWGADVIGGNGALNEVNGRLEYTSTRFGANEANRPWILNFGGYGENWAIQLDVFNSHVAGGGEVTSCGFEVFQGGNSLNSVFVELYTVHTANGKGFYSVLRNNNVYAAEQATGDLNATLGTVQISYDGLNKVLTSSYDPDGSANGFQWIQFATFGINGSGGSTGNANWGMNDSSEFSVSVYGYSEKTDITSGMIYVDNFIAVPEPSNWPFALLAAGAAIISRSRGRSQSRGS
jgi:hypothetical protein